MQSTGNDFSSTTTYVYDNAGRLSVEGDDSVLTTYTYDQASQLVADGTTTYTLDAAGNRTSGNNVIGTDNQLLSDGTWTYSYDAAGNLIKKSMGANATTWTYGYDDRNQLAWAQERATDGGTLLMQETFTYDVYGNMIAQTITTTESIETDYAYDAWQTHLAQPMGPTTQVATTPIVNDLSNWNVFLQLQGTSEALTTRFLFGDTPNQLLGQQDAGNTATWVVNDRQGSVRAVVNSQGDVVDSIRYDGWGNIISESQPTAAILYGWQGQMRDTLLNVNFDRARVYIPAIARWQTPDPLGLIAGDINLYRAVHNNFTDYTDPSSLQQTPDYAGQMQALKKAVRPQLATPDNAAWLRVYKDAGVLQAWTGLQSAYDPLSRLARQDLGDPALARRTDVVPERGADETVAMGNVKALLRHNGVLALSKQNAALSLAKTMGKGLKYASPFLGQNMTAAVSQMIQGMFTGSSEPDPLETLSKVATKALSIVLPSDKAQQYVQGAMSSLKQLGDLIAQNQENDPVYRARQALARAKRQGADAATLMTLSMDLKKLTGTSDTLSLGDAPVHGADGQSSALVAMGQAGQQIEILFDYFKTGAMAGLGAAGLLSSLGGGMSLGQISKAAVKRALVLGGVGAVGGYVYGGLSGGHGWDGTRAKAGALSGGMLGAGLGLSFGTSAVASAAGGTLVGSGLGGLSVLRQTAGTDAFTWGDWGKSTIINGGSAFASSVTGLYLSGRLGQGVLGHVLTGAYSSAAGNVTGQILDYALNPASRSKPLAERLLSIDASFVGGGVGGLFSWGLTRRLVDPATGLVKCGVSSVKYVGLHALGAFAGGMVNSALDQGVRMLFDPNAKFSVAEMLESGAISAATSVPAALGELSLGKACFAAGTPMRTAEGWRAIEEIRVGDMVWTRDERYPDGPVVLKEVQEVFVRTACIMALRVGGRVIRTTSEHPFYAEGRGWVAAGDLAEGDQLATEDGRWLAVEGVENTGLWVRVYNLRVADFHTYFVGCEEWGFAVWAHNTYNGNEGDLLQRRLRNAGASDELVDLIHQIGSAPGDNGTAWQNQFKGRGLRHIVAELEALPPNERAHRLLQQAYDTGVVNDVSTMERQVSYIHDNGQWTRRINGEVAQVVPPEFVIARTGSIEHSDRFVFAHGTSAEHALNIRQNGLSETDAAANWGGGSMARRGEFNTFGAGPPEQAGRGPSEAYGMGGTRRYGDEAVLILAALPSETFRSMVAQGHVRVDTLPGAPAEMPQVLFLPSGYPTFNQHGSVQIMDLIQNRPNVNLGWAPIGTPTPGWSGYVI